MSTTAHPEDPEPSEPVPAGPLYVPVRPGPAGCATRFFRTPPGERTAVGFTSEARLTATLGADQSWITLSEPALRALAEPLGVRRLTVDPQFSAPAPVPALAAKPLPAWRDGDPRHVGALRVTGAAAVVSCMNLLIG
ncbi:MULTISPECIES: SAV_915 family protein [unclassified Streptomyces]|uniref:SAV_915 family protein n=1 Tax=unclassified Streptomyces TaxID=2593676 RepID=UPI0037A37D31